MKRIKGNTSERIFKEFSEMRKKYWGQRFWARGYFVSTVGIDEEVIKKYIKEQKKMDNQSKLWAWPEATKKSVVFYCFKN